VQPFSADKKEAEINAEIHTDNNTDIPDEIATDNGIKTIENGNNEEIGRNLAKQTEPDTKGKEEESVWAGLGMDAVSTVAPVIGLALICIAISAGAGALTLPLAFPYILSVIMVGGFTMILLPKDMFVLGKIATNQSFNFTKSLNKSALNGLKKIKAQLKKDEQLSEEQQENSETFQSVSQKYTPEDTNTISHILQSGDLTIYDAEKILENIKANPNINMDNIINSFKLDKYLGNQNQNIGIRVPPKTTDLKPPKSKTSIEINSGELYTKLDDPNGHPIDNGRDI